MANEIRKITIEGQTFDIEDAVAKQSIETINTRLDSDDKSADIATDTKDGFMSKTDKSKLDGIEEGATKLEIASDTVLGGIKVGNTLTIDSTTGELNAVGYTLPKATDSVLGGVKLSTSIVADATIDGAVKVADNSHAHTIANVTGLQTALDNKLETSLKGVADGVAELDSTGKVPTSQLPSYVDDVIEGYYNTLDGKFYKEQTYSTEIPGETGKIYVSLDTNKTYRWTGSSTFVEISASLALGETSSTAYAGDKGKAVTDALTAHTASAASDVHTIDNITGLTDALDEKSPLIHTHSVTDITDLTKASATADGLMSKEDFTKLSGIENGANNYTLPPATDTDLGGIRVGANLTIVSGGILSANYSDASQTTSGLMSAADKTKLDGITDGATKVTKYDGTRLETVKIGTNLTVDQYGVLDVPVATTSTPGVIQVGNGLTSVSGTISTDFTYHSVSGRLDFGNGIKVVAD